MSNLTCYRYQLELRIRKQVQTMIFFRFMSKAFHLIHFQLIRQNRFRLDFVVF